MASWRRDGVAIARPSPTRAAARHVRLTVADGVMSAALIESPHANWRQELAAHRYRTVVPPVRVARGVRRLLAVRRLRSAALDFAVDRAGRWWFLEVDPDRNWSEGGAGGS